MYNAIFIAIFQFFSSTKHFPYCLEHQESERKLLLIKDDRAHLCCSQCLFQLRDTNHSNNTNDIINLEIIEKWPEELIGKLIPENESDIIDKFVKSSNILVNFLSQIRSLKKVIEQLEQQIMRKLTESQKAQMEMKQQFVQILKIDQFFLNLKKLKKMGKSEQDNIQQIGDTLSQLIRQCQKNSEQISNQIKVIVQAKTIQFQRYYDVLILISLITDTNDLIQNPKQLSKKIFDTLEEEISQIYQSSSQLVDEIYFSQLLQNVEQKLQFKFKASKLFVGSQDGLTFKALWNKVQGKEKLLFIFKSQSGFVFGAFTPQKWSQEGQYYQDDQLSSFLFSYTLNEIYPIKSSTKSYSSLIQVGNYLLFGGTQNNNQDLLFKQNFTEGSSQLGVCYEAKGKDSSKPSSYLFGGLKPNVIECEVFELI